MLYIAYVWNPHPLLKKVELIETESIMMVASVKRVDLKAVSPTTHAKKVIDMLINLTVVHFTVHMYIK